LLRRPRLSSARLSSARFGLAFVASQTSLPLASARLLQTSVVAKLL